MMSRCVEIRRARSLLGTFVDLTVRGASKVIVERALAAGFAAVAEVHRLMNFHDPKSELSLLNRAGACTRLSLHPWTRHVLRAARQFAELSDGAFNVSPGADWRRLVFHRNGTVAFTGRLEIDLGGIAKGFAVDRAVAAIKSAGALSGIVNAGGDLRVFGRRAESVDVRDPSSPSRSGGTLVVCNRAVATSGNYFRVALHHGRCAARMPNNRSITVVASDCMTADALTKIVAFLPESVAVILKRYRAQAFVLERDRAPRWICQNHVA